jgi:hypothetical protein
VKEEIYYLPTLHRSNHSFIMTSLTASLHDNTQRNNLTPPPPSPSPPPPPQAHYTPLQNTSNMNAMARTPPISTMYSAPATRTPVYSGSLGQHSEHGPPPKIMPTGNHKAASMRNMHYAVSPVPSRLMGPKSRSLIGFDPLLVDPTPTSTSTPVRSTTVVAHPHPQPQPQSLTPPPPLLGGGTPQQQRRPRIVPPTHASASASHTPQQLRQSSQPKQKALTPQHKPSQSKKQHRRDVQSFCVSDLRSISQDAMEQENQEASDHNVSTTTTQASDLPGASTLRASNHNMKQAPLNASNHLNTSSHKAPQPAKVPLTPITAKEKLSDPKKEIMTPTPSKEIPRPKDPARDSKSPKRDSGTGAGTPPRSLKMPWAKKGHRRIQSLEFKSGHLPTGETNHRSSLPNTPAREKQSSMYPAMIQDLIELSFSQLQMPSLAKPSPTSFLTGKEDEVVRTCELDPSPHQMEIPTLPEFVVMSRLNEFVENYRRVDQNFDLQQWVGMSRMDLRQVRIPQHQPIVQSLLECGDDVTLQGAIIKGANADERSEVVVFEGQRQFTVVFRGTTEQQCKPGGSKSKKNGKHVAVPLDAEHQAEVYGCFKEEYAKLEPECFALLDKLTEQNPFCDVVFSGYSFGATMASLAAFRYANARPQMRVSCLTMASPKVGFSAFKQLVNSSPNLKVMRLEFGQDSKCQAPAQAGSHVGHTLVLHGSLGHNSLKTNQPVMAYKFDVPKYKKFKTTHPDMRSYMSALEEMARLGLPWTKDFVGTSGQGVVVNNEARQVV